MRLDLFLKLSRLVIRRSVASEICHAGAVSVNDTVAKASHNLKINDIITLRRGGRLLSLRVLALPQGNVAKAAAASLYEVLYSKPYNEVDELLKA